MIQNYIFRFTSNDEFNNYKEYIEHISPLSFAKY